MSLVPAAGRVFPDLALPDHAGRPRTLSELAAGDPLVLVTSPGWRSPEERRFLRGLVALQDEVGRARAGLAVLSVDPPEAQAAFRAGLAARFPFLSDAGRVYLDALGLREEADTVHELYRPAAFSLRPDLRVHRDYDGGEAGGRPAPDELRRDVRELSASLGTVRIAPAA